MTFAVVTCATCGTPRHRSRCGVWTPPCGDRLGSVQFFSPAHRADRPAVQRWSSRPRRRSSARRVSCKRRQPPARSHSTKRRQHVLPEPHPISRGNICHGNPPRITNRMPVSAAHGDGASEATARDAPTAHRPRGAVPCATVPCPGDDGRSAGANADGAASLGGSDAFAWRDQKRRP